MRMILFLVAILVTPWLLLLGLSAAGLFAWQPALYGRVSLALLLAFTGVGHFVETRAMAAMLPVWVPARRVLVLVTGALEWALGAALVLPGWSSNAGIAVIAFLVAVFPANVYAAHRRVAFGGHAQGPKYLLPRGLLQLILILWAYACAVA